MRVALLLDTFHEVNGVANTYRRFWNFSQRVQLPADFIVYGNEDGVEERSGKTRLFQFKPRHAFRYYEDLKLEVLPNRKLKGLLKREDYDVVHIAAPGSLGLMGIQAARRRKSKIVGAFHTKLAEYAGHMTPKLISRLSEGCSWGILKWFYNQCDLVLPTTPLMGQYLKRNGIHKPLKVFSRGVDSSLFHPRKRVRKANPEDPTILYVGRISEEKNLPMLAEALGKLWARGLSFRARFVGDGPLRKTLQRRLPNAEFDGYLHGEALAAAYADADIFAFPSKTDTFGNVVLEALASGLPSVVASEQGPGEIIQDGFDGTLAESPEAFESALYQLLADQELRGRMSHNARQRAEARDWDAVFWDLWSQYQSLALTRSSSALIDPATEPR
jgi:glycosyltransferase involved in cell wall biosynthesis